MEKDGPNTIISAHSFFGMRSPASFLAEEEIQFRVTCFHSLLARGLAFVLIGVVGGFEHPSNPGRGVISFGFRSLVTRADETRRIHDSIPEPNRSVRIPHYVIFSRARSSTHSRSTIAAMSATNKLNRFSCHNEKP